MFRLCRLTRFLFMCTTIVLLTLCHASPGSAVIPEGGVSAPESTAGLVYLPGTNVDQALGPALDSDDLVPVIIMLKRTSSWAKCGGRY